MIKGSVGTVITQYYHHSSPLVLESGDTLTSLTIAYETYGKLNRDRNNAILICHALSGDAHIAGFLEGEDKPGWWDAVVGPGKAFDTDRYCHHLLECDWRVQGIDRPLLHQPENRKTIRCEISRHHHQ